MEKRLLLAFVLSFFVIYFWSIFFTKNPYNNSQTINNKELTSESVNSRVEDLSPRPTDNKKDTSRKENLAIIQNNALELSFSDAGGYLKKVFLKDFNHALPLTNIFKLKEYDYAYSVIKNSGNQIVYLYEDGDLKITKLYQLDQDNSLKASLSIENRSKMSKVINVDIIGMSLEMSKVDIKSYDKSNYEYIAYSGQNYVRKNNAFKFENREQKNILGSVNWLGFRERYFCFIIKPLYKTISYSFEPTQNTQMDINMESRGLQISAGGSVNFDYQVFAGPEDVHLLNKYDKDFSKIKMFYRFSLFDFVAHVLYRSLHFIHKIIPNWGVNIILICVGIYLLMYPLTLSSMSSMKKMQSLQPRINQLKEKHKNDQQKQSMELMQLYRENKINPLGGCLPLVLQMPFFLGIYQVLWRDVSFKGAHFLWIKDLTLPDRLIVLPYNILFLGNEINILPILYAVAMFFQQRFSSKNMVGVDPAQLEAQKMMTVFMPIMLAVLFYKFPSGTTLYFTVFFLLTAFTQWKMSRI